jgi:hypothetical protein
MALLSLAVEKAMGELRSGRDVVEVRAGVVELLSSAFGPEQAAAIADFLVTPGVSNMGGADVLAKLSSATGVYDGPSHPAAWWPTDDDSPEVPTMQFGRGELLSRAVGVAMEEQRSGRDVDEVRAGVIATLGSAFHPDLAAVIADSLVAPGMSQKGKVEVLAATVEALEAEIEASTKPRRPEVDQRYELMVGLAAIVPTAIGELRSGPGMTRRSFTCRAQET